MSQRIRTIYFFVTVALFLILAPIIVFYASGYRLDLTKRAIIKTGSLVVTSIPDGAQVTLDDNALSSSSSGKISSLIPGDHSLRLTLPGYLDWTSTVRIRPNASTVIKQAVLFRADLSQVQLWQGRSQLAEVSNDLRRLSVFDEANHTLVVQNTGANQVAPIQYEISGTINALAWSPNGQRLLISEQRKPDTHEFSIREPWVSSVQRNVQAPEPLVKVWWSAASDDLLYGASATALYQLDLFTGKNTTVLRGQVVDFLPYSTGGYALVRSDATTELFWIDPSLPDQPSLITLDSTDMHFLPGHQHWFGIRDNTRERCTLFRRGSNGPLTRIVLPERCTFVDFQTSGNFALTGDGYSLRRVTLKTGAVETLTRQSTLYRQAFWYKKGQVALVVQPGGLDALDYANEIPIRTRVTTIPNATALGLTPAGSLILAATNDDGTTAINQLTLQ